MKTSEVKEGENTHIQDITPAMRGWNKVTEVAKKQTDAA
jgi:hypothetical protein